MINHRGEDVAPTQQVAGYACETGMLPMVLAKDATDVTTERNITVQTEHLRITGMICGGCSGNVTRTLKAIAGVGDVTVSLSSGEATVQFDERLTSPDQLKSAVKDAGYGVDAATATHGHKSKGGCCG